MKLAEIPIGICIVGALTALSDRLVSSKYHGLLKNHIGTLMRFLGPEEVQDIKCGLYGFHFYEALSG